jgi:hypothetical protein
MPARKDLASPTEFDKAKAVVKLINPLAIDRKEFCEANPCVTLIERC